MANRKRSKSHNKRKGPQLSEGERLWKRLNSLFGNNDQLWQKEWDLQSLADFIIEKEKLSLRFSRESKAERKFRAELSSTLTEARKDGQYFIVQESRKLVVRSKSVIEEIKKNVEEWRAFFSKYTGKVSGITAGPPILDAGKDEETYQLMEQSWLAFLNGDKPPGELSLLEDEVLRKWGSFDLLREINKFASKRTGFRFHEDEPSIALLLLQNKVLTPIELLENRLRRRRKDNRNPFPETYDPTLCKLAEELSEVDGEKEISNGRTDLRHLPLVTIDPHDAKDFDDAVCLINNGEKTVLWVAIADVANYVQPDTRLDSTARARATSVYLPHAVLPMLPPRLADDLCSLRANVDRLAMVISMTIEGSEIIETAAYEAVIRVKQNLAYEDALDNPEFKNMFELASNWQKKEIRLNIHNAEMRPRIDESNNITVEVKWPNEATKMIESFMVATNSAVGHLLGSKGAPLPWRCHTPPDGVEVKALNAKLSALGVDIELPMPSTKTHGQSDSEELSNLLGAWAQSTGGGIDIEVPQTSSEQSNDIPEYLSNVLDSNARQDILDALMMAQTQASNLDSTIRRIVDQGLFQLMQRANYSSENLGHFGLNLDAYVHFTSPIRRYPDLIVHRQLKAFLKGQEWVHDLQEVETLSLHCAEQSLMAKYLEWELVANIYHIHLLRGGEIGTQTSQESIPIENKSWQARIVGLRTPWVFLDLQDDGAIQGRMHLRQLGRKHQLSVDEHGLNVISSESDDTENQKPVVRLGQHYPCRLRGIDIWSGSLDLAPK
jgi:exoribonuclease R